MKHGLLLGRLIGTLRTGMRVMGFKPGSLLRMALLLSLSPIASATTWYVNGVSGSDTNNCLSASTACKSIGHAISLAASSGDTIRVAAAIYVENLNIGKSLTIAGVGATTIIDGGSVNTVVAISSGSVIVTLSNLTIRNGATTGETSVGGGIRNLGTLAINAVHITGNRSCAGGGISNGGVLTINKSTISGNSVFQGGICDSLGAGISNSGRAIINNSTISGNTASGTFGPRGGGILNWGTGTLTINNSTITGNVLAESGTFAGTKGGAIFNFTGGTVRINSSTISANGAQFGGNLYGNATIQNSIVANSLFGGNCNGAVTSQGYNLTSDGTCAFTGPGDMNNSNPKLGPLQHNGGPTQTMALLSGSPAIDAGNPAGCKDNTGALLKTDQRGDPRPDDEDTGGCDIGAFENNGTLTGSCIVPVGHECVSGAATLEACPAGTPVVSPGDVVCGLIQNLVPVGQVQALSSFKHQRVWILCSGYSVDVARHWTTILVGSS